MNVHTKQIFIALSTEVLEIIDGAMRALESGQTTELARSQLKEVCKRLQAIELEYRGSCSW